MRKNSNGNLLVFSSLELLIGHLVLVVGKLWPKNTINKVNPIRGEILVTINPELLN